MGSRRRPAGAMYQPRSRIDIMDDNMSPNVRASPAALPPTTSARGGFPEDEAAVHVDGSGHWETIVRGARCIRLEIPAVRSISLAIWDRYVARDSYRKMGGVVRQLQLHPRSGIEDASDGGHAIRFSSVRLQYLDPRSPRHAGFGGGGGFGTAQSGSVKDTNPVMKEASTNGTGRGGEIFSGNVRNALGLVQCREPSKHGNLRAERVDWHASGYF
ncbi:hypothetical protein BC628DRAFT_1027102 [Trametes gibbosa]|nr:hypothetical protein BC628DRAFT_1027102 [Trametes gibbosa]